MNSQSVVNWVQMLSTIALVVGLGLVIFELRQSRDIAKAQVSSDSMSLAGEQLGAQYPEDYPDVLAKACMNSEELTEAELLTLNTNFLFGLQHARRNWHITKRSDLYDEDQWKNVLEMNLRATFSTFAGRAWWEAMGRHAAEPEIQKYGDELLAIAGPPSCHQFLLTMKQRIVEMKAEYGKGSRG